MYRLCCLSPAPLSSTSPWLRNTSNPSLPPRNTALPPCDCLRQLQNAVTSPCADNISKLMDALQLPLIACFADMMWPAWLLMLATLLHNNEIVPVGLLQVTQAGLLFKATQYIRPSIAAATTAHLS